MKRLFVLLNVVALSVLFLCVSLLYRQNMRLEACNARLSAKVNAFMEDEVIANLKDRLGELTQSVDGQLSRLNKLQEDVTEIQSDMPEVKKGLNNALARIRAADRSIDIAKLGAKLDRLELEYRDIDLKLDDWAELKGSVENIGKYVFGAYPCDDFRYKTDLWNKSLKDQMDELVNTIRLRTRY